MYQIKLRKIENICHLIRTCCFLHNLSNDEDIQQYEVVSVPQPTVVAGQPAKEEGDDDEEEQNDIHFKYIKKTVVYYILL